MFLFAHSLLAQFDVEITLIGTNDISPYNRGSKGFDLRYEGVKGDPLLFKDWQTTSIQLTNRDTFSASAKINVDLIAQVLIIQLRNGTSGQIPLSKIKAFKIENPDGTTRLWKIYSEKEIEGSTGEGLKPYEVLVEGDFTLLKRMDKKFKKASFKEAYSIGNRYDEYVPTTDYWFREGKKPYQEIKLKRKAIEEALSAHTETVEKAMKAQKLDLTSEKEVVQLLKTLEK